jgi:hypothetical protein
MKKWILKMLFIGFGVLSITTTTYGQSLLSTTNEEDGSIVSNGVLIEGIDNEESWAVYSDEDHRKFYVDLEKLHILLDKIHVYDDTNKIVFTDNLWNVTPNSIYELDFKDFKTGKYRLEFRTINEEKFYKIFDIK